MATGSVGLLSHDVLLRIFAVGGLGQRELGRCGCVCRDWRAVHRAPALWQRLLRSLCLCFGTDPFFGVEDGVAPNAAATVDEAWFGTHGLLYRSLQQQCRAWSERVAAGAPLAGGNMSALTASERRRARTLWDVLCCRSPLQRFQLQQRRLAKPSKFPAQRQEGDERPDDCSEAWQRDRSLHIGVWEARRVAESDTAGAAAATAATDGSWRRVVPRSGATSSDILAHVCMTWLLCQQHDPLARQPGLGYMWTPYVLSEPTSGASPGHLLGLRPGSSTESASQAEDTVLSAEAWCGI